MVVLKRERMLYLLDGAGYMAMRRRAATHRSRRLHLPLRSRPERCSYSSEVPEEVAAARMTSKL